MMVRKDGALEVYMKIVLHNIGRTHVAAPGMLGAVTVHFKNHEDPPCSCLVDCTLHCEARSARLPAPPSPQLDKEGLLAFSAGLPRPLFNRNKGPIYGV